MITPALLTSTSSPSTTLSHLPPQNQTPYIYKIVPVNLTTNHNTTTHLAAITSDDSLRLLDARTLRDIDIVKPTNVPNPVHEGVTCLQGSAKNDDYDDDDDGGGGGGGGEGGGLVWTAGRDGVVRGFDLRVGHEKKMTVELSSSDG